MDDQNMNNGMPMADDQANASDENNGGMEEAAPAGDGMGEGGEAADHGTEMPADGEEKHDDAM